MKIHIPTTKEVDVAFVSVILPVRYGDEDIPYDFPLRINETWSAIIEVDTGKIHDWPQGKTGSLYMKVCDSGVYTLLDRDRAEIAQRNDYVPHGLIPGDYGDYVDLNIDEEGIITNWPKEPDLDAFFKQGDEE